MAESKRKKLEPNGDKYDDEDYMGDLSKLLPPEAFEPPKPSDTKKISNTSNVTGQSSKKKSKTLNWQEQRKLDRERRQIEEDEQTKARIEVPISQSNIGFKLLKQMGYKPGSTLGKESSGLAEPVGLEIRRSRAGIGRDDPHKEKRKRDEIRAERKKRNVEALMEDFGSRQKSQWRTRKVVVDYKKAKAALDQLENREVIDPVKNEDDEDGGQHEEEEEEEEEITEEDLQELLMKLRDEHKYCLFCGCQYESKEDLLSNCPGVDEEDH